jgi:DNA replication protein DnaC
MGRVHPEIGKQSAEDPVCRFCKGSIEQRHDRSAVSYCANPVCINAAKMEYAAKHIDELMIKSQIPLKFRKIKTDADLSKYKDLKSGLYIWGGAGSGKTVFECSIARQLILNLQSVKFFSTIDLIFTLYDKWRRPDEQIKKYIDETVLSSQFIILDDLGSEKITDYVRSTFFYIFNAIEMNEKIPIITSNYSLEEIDRHLGARIASRISGMCEIIKFIGHDRRIKGGVNQ